MGTVNLSSLGLRPRKLSSPPEFSCSSCRTCGCKLSRLRCTRHSVNFSEPLTHAFVLTLFAINVDVCPDRLYTLAMYVISLLSYLSFLNFALAYVTSMCHGTP